MGQKTGGNPLSWDLLLPYFGRRGGTAEDVITEGKTVGWPEWEQVPVHSLRRGLGWTQLAPRFPLL